MSSPHTYVDAYVLAVPTKNKEAYIEKEKTMALVFKEYGATRVTEYWGDDIPTGEVTSLPMAVQCKDDETVVMGFVFWESKEQRDTGMQAAMEDKRFQDESISELFDGKRMIYGSFDKVIDA